MRTLLKWNLIFILFFICLASCQKETPQNQAGVKSLQEVETTDLDSFNSLLSDVRATMTSNLRNSGCANSRNPEDYQGERHNEILEELNVGGYINGSIDSLLVAFERHTQLAVEGSSSFYISLHDEMDSLIYFRDGSYNGAYLSSLSEVLPTVEIEILNNS